jgi:arylsulfatase A-like enzyme
LSADDTSVPILLSMPGIGPSFINTPVRNQQIAPTILAALGLDPRALQAVRVEHTDTLPGAVQAIQTMP